MIDIDYDKSLVTIDIDDTADGRNAKEFIRYLNRILIVRELNARYGIGNSSGNFDQFKYFTLIECCILDRDAIYLTDPRALSWFWQSTKDITYQTSVNKDNTTYTSHIMFPKPGNLIIPTDIIHPYVAPDSDSELKQLIFRIELKNSKIDKEIEETFNKYFEDEADV